MLFFIENNFKITEENISNPYVKPQFLEETPLLMRNYLNTKMPVLRHNSTAGG